MGPDGLQKTREIVGLVVEQNAGIAATASIGIAKARGSYLKADEVIRDAGIALRSARESGAGTVMVFNIAMEGAGSIAT